jgi:hypothetical protein
MSIYGNQILAGQRRTEFEREAAAHRQMHSVPAEELGPRVTSGRRFVLLKRRKGARPDLELRPWRPQGQISA